MIEPRVLGTRVLLKPLDAHEATTSGIFIPDEARKKESRGVVVAVGKPYAGDLEPPVAVGDVVVYDADGTRHFGQPVPIRLDRDENGVAEDLVVVEYADLLLVLEDVPSRKRVEV